VTVKTALTAILKPINHKVKFNKMKDLFSTPIKSKKVRNGIYAHQYRNGTININGHKFLYCSLSYAIKQWRLKNKK